MAEGKSEEELMQTAQNICKERGIDMNQAFEQFKREMMGGDGMPGNVGMNR